MRIIGLYKCRLDDGRVRERERRSERERASGDTASTTAIIFRAENIPSTKARRKTIEEPIKENQDYHTVDR